MKNNRTNDMSDRLRAAGEAKAALVKAYRAAKDAAEPTREARQVERLALAEARETRRKERERTKRDESARNAAEAAEHEAAIAALAQAEIDARELADKNRIARLIEDEATRKLARDLRYANRKARRS